MKFEPKFYPLISTGKKTCTTRLKRKAEPNQIFHYPTFAILIRDVREMSYWSAVVDGYWKADGFDNPKDYCDELERIYPELKYGDPSSKTVFVHTFVTIPDFEKEAQSWDELTPEMQYIVESCFAPGHLTLYEASVGGFQ